MIRILGTTRNEFFSNTIRKVTGEEISHVVVQVDDQIIHANRHGVVIQSIESFVEENTIIYSLLPISPEYAKNTFDIIQKKIPHLVGRPYDQFYLAYFALRMILKSWFKMPIPKVDLWDVSSMYICTELASEAIDYKMESMLTPEGLLDKLASTGLWEYC